MISDLEFNLYNLKAELSNNKLLSLLPQLIISSLSIYYIFSWIITEVYEKKKTEKESNEPCQARVYLSIRT